MATFLKVFGAVLLGVVLLLGAGLAALLVLDWDVIRDDVQAVLSGALGREIEIGELGVEPGWTSRIALIDLRVANADWAEDQSLLEAEMVVIFIEVWPLLGGRIVLSEATVTQPRLSLQRNAEGLGNWEPVEPAGEAAAPETRQEFPTVGRLRIKDGKIAYRDAVREIDTEGSIATAEAEAKDPDAIDASLRGTLQGEDLSLDFSGASPLVLRQADRPYPIDLRIALGETKLSVAGEIMEPIKLQGLDLNFALEGQSLADIFPLFAIPLPETPPYSLAGQLRREDGLWSAEGIEGRVGDSDLSGSLSLDQSGKKPFLKAELLSKKLHLDDLRGFIGGTAPSEGGEKAGQRKEEKNQQNASLFPDVPLADERLHAMNMDVIFEGKEIMAEGFPIDAISARIQLTDGRLLARPLTISIADGRASGEIALNTREEVPSADMRLAFRDLNLTPFFEGTEFVQETGGRFSGKISALGVGQSLHEMMASARGKGWLGIRDGSISALLVEAAGLDVAEALVLIADSDARVGIRCGRVDVEASDGIVSAKRAIIDTTDSILVAQGSANLASELFDLQIEARAKDFSLIDASAPVTVAGKFDDPTISIGRLDPLPFLEMGNAEDLSCEKLLSGEPESSEDHGGSSSN